MHRPADANPLSHNRPAAPVPVLSQTARDLRRHHAERLVQQAREEMARHTTGEVTVTTVADDVALWLAVFAREVPAPLLSAAFRARAAVHAVAGLSMEDSLTLHHVCVDVLNRAVAGCWSQTRDRTAPDTGLTATTLDALRAASTAVVHELGRQETGPRPQRTPPAPALLFPAAAAPAPRWCLAAIRPGSSVKEAQRRFRADNPHASIVTAGTHLTAFTHHPPAAPEVLAPYALVPVENGNTAGAARRAALAAVIARHYRRSLTAEHVLPLIAALDLTAKDRDAFATACLGPLHTSDRHRYLLDTLAAYLAHNLCVTAAARSLFIHRHTLTYRLRSIQLLTSLDLDRPLDRLQAELALLLCRADAVRALPRRHTA
ncbi:hypothetical protein GPA10_27920 [Streptomyces sp. p1417]|uniref:PucR C-terminal helix-turn-helix domain-containing protein n=1 Tax=Streptomyces typhae TaxID=2681492 RepID=A0A6L6X436_9ACTN|nr:hypothetical protein [Streptomyces typhae]